MLPMVFIAAVKNETPEVTVTVDANTWFFGLVSLLFMIIGFFIVRYIHMADKNYNKLETKIDEGFKGFDSRLDKLEINQAILLAQKRR